jgi:WD40 repeat protein
MKTLSIGRRNFHGVAYSADGRFLVSLNSMNQLRFWEMGSFVERFSCRFPHGWPNWGSPFTAWGGTFSLCGNLLPWRTAVYDLTATWEYLRKSPADRDTVPQTPCKQVPLPIPSYTNLRAVATDGKCVIGATHRWAEGGKSQLRIWDFEGKQLDEFDAPEGIRHWGGLTLAPDGRTLAAPSETTAVVLIDLPTRKGIARLVHTSKPSRMVFSQDGRFLATTAGRCVWLWDVASRRAIQRFGAFKKSAEALAFHPDGRLLAAGSVEGEVRVWDTAGCREVACLDWKIGAVHGLAFSPDGMTAAAAGHNGTLVIWDIE